MKRMTFALTLGLSALFLSSATLSAQALPAPQPLPSTPKNIACKTFGGSASFSNIYKIAYAPDTDVVVMTAGSCIDENTCSEKPFGTVAIAAGDDQLGTYVAWELDNTSIVLTLTSKNPAEGVALSGTVVDMRNGYPDIRSVSCVNW